MAHINPLHPPVNSTQYSAVNSLAGALSMVLPPDHTSQAPCPRLLPQPSYTPVSKWKAATGAADPRLPVITFDYVGQQKQGIPMRELSARNIVALGQMLQGANDPVFAETGLKRITLRILWPGYTHVDWARSINLVASGPITRTQLATQLAANFSRFMEIARTQKPTSADYSIGPSSIQFEHLVLIGLHNVLEDVWQADVAIDRR
ncbi:hypothetical protein H1R20_g6038, partial [Candolleomyces eurysporus]